MAQSILDLILRSSKKGTAAKEVQKELKDTEKQVEKTGKKAKESSGNFSILDGVMLGVGNAALDMGMQLLRSIPAMAEQGQEIKRAQAAFEAYTGGGQRAAEMLDAVKDASDGALSRTEAMQSATRLLAMGLASTAEEAGKLTQGAITLGATMGKGPQEAFEEFTLLLANQSILRLDTFGISGAKVRTRMEELAAEVQGLSKEERFNIAVMEEMDRKMALLEDGGFDATSSLDEFKAVVKDTKDELAVAVTEGIEPFIEALLEMRRANIDEQESALESADTWEEYVALITGAKGPIMITSQAIGGLTREEFELIKALEEGNNTITGWEANMFAAAEATREMELSQEELQEQLGILKEIIRGTVSNELESFKQSESEIKTKLEENIRTIDELNGKTYLTEEQQQQLASAREDYDANKAKLEELTAKHEESTARIIFSYFEQAAARDGYTEEEIAALTQIGKELGIYDDTTARTLDNVNAAWAAFLASGQMDEVAAKARSITDAINGIPKFTEINIKIRTTEIVTRALDRGETSSGPGGQFGLDMVVPPGFPNDTFPVRASSGERVIVEPAGNRGAPGGGDVIIENNIFMPAGISLQGMGEAIRQMNKKQIASAKAGSGFSNG